MCTGAKEVEVVPYAERTDYAKVLKNIEKGESESKIFRGDQESKMLVTSYEGNGCLHVKGKFMI